MLTLPEDERLKFGPAVTVTETEVFAVKLPDVPVIVTRTLLTVVAVLLAVSVRALEPVPGFGLNEAVTPLGSPEATKVTPALNPFCGITLMVLAPLAPCVMLTPLGDAESV